MNLFGSDGFGTKAAPRRGLWFLRIVPLVSTILILLAMLVIKSGNYHDFLLGLAVGLLISMTVQAFAIKSVELNEPPQQSDVQNLPVTR